MKNTYQTIEHDIAPVYDDRSRILLLGTLPSVLSRESHFFYGNPRNRFYQLLARLLQDELPVTIAEKKAFLRKHRIAVWDVVAKCDIIGSGDSSIKNVVPTDLAGLLAKTGIRQIFANGQKAAELYERYQEPLTGRRIIRLPSTSPANAAYTLERLAEHWQEILTYLH